MNDLQGAFAMMAVLAVIVLAIAAILMPLYVIIIESRVAKIQKTLAAMEHMMRHGK